jgi:hypothetical protein
MTHQAVADHFNVSRITISMLMIRLRQKTGNDRPRNGRPRVTSQRQDRHSRSFRRSRGIDVLAKIPIFRMASCLLMLTTFPNFSVTEQDVIVCFVR